MHGSYGPALQCARHATRLYGRRPTRYAGYGHSMIHASCRLDSGIWGPRIHITLERISTMSIFQLHPAIGLQKSGLAPARTPAASSTRLRWFMVAWLHG